MCRFFNQADQQKLVCSSSLLPSPPATTIRPRRKAAAKSALFVFIATVSSDFSQVPEKRERITSDSWGEHVCVCAQAHKVDEVKSGGTVVHLQRDRMLLSFQRMTYPNRSPTRQLQPGQGSHTHRQQGQKKVITNSKYRKGEKEGQNNVGRESSWMCVRTLKKSTRKNIYHLGWRCRKHCHSRHIIIFHCRAGKVRCQAFKLLGDFVLFQSSVHLGGLIGL